VTILDSITDQQKPVRILKTLLRTGAVPHAMIFTGIEGVGKQHAAEAFAMACNCPTLAAALAGDPPVPEKSDIEPCGRCRSCRKIQSGSHPDILHLKPTGVAIRIPQVRELSEALAMKPYEARTRVVIIHGAQTLNLHAGNALLKLLEEPPDRTLFILTAPQTVDVMPTIVSRCQPVHFYPVSKNRIADILQNEGLDSKEAVMLAAMAQGSPIRARELQHKGFNRRRDWYIRASGLEAPERLKPTPCGPLLAFAEALSANKERALEALDALIVWLRDLLVVRYAPGLIVNADRLESLKHAADSTSIAWLLHGVETIQSARRSLESNCNTRLTLEVMMLRLARPLSPTTAHRE